MAHRVPITVRLDHFEGPLDLLLFLIQNHELNISVISISRITNQYLEYVKLIQDLNFDIASEFLVMASTLLYWKSKAVLPKESEETDSEEEDFGPTPEDLVRQLLEHQRFLEAGDELSQFPKLGEDVFTRPNQKPEIHRIWRELNISDLALSYQETVIKANRPKKILKKETVSLSEKIVELATQLPLGELVPMSKLYENNPIRPEKVVSFLASLELSRLRKLNLYQSEVYAPIYLKLIESLKNFDLALASGFDYSMPEEKPPVQPEGNA